MSRYGANGKKIYSLVVARCKADEITIKEFERNAGLSNGYIRKLGLGNEPSADKIAKIAKGLGTTSDFLLDGVSSFNNGKNGSGVAIPLLAKVAYGLPVSQNEVIGEEIIPEKLASGGEYFALRMNDDTMAPYILKFDRLIVRVDPDIDAWGYDKVALAHEGKASAICANIRSAENGTWVIYNNPVYGAQFWEKGSTEFTIVGEVVEIRRTL